MRRRYANPSPLHHVVGGSRGTRRIFIARRRWSGALVGIATLLVTVAGLILLRSSPNADRSVSGTSAAPTGRPRSVAPLARATVRLDEGSTIRPSVVRLRSGQDLRLLIENESPLQHDFIIDELDAHAELGLGESATLMLSGLEPGTYASWCSLDGHHDRLKVIVR